MALMTAKKKKPAKVDEGAEKDRHAAHSMVRLAPDLHKQLKELAKKNRRPLAWELRRMIEDGLAAEGLWPPPEVE